MRACLHGVTAALVGVFAAATAAAAETPCGDAGRIPMTLESLVRPKAEAVAHLWGRENMSFVPDGPTSPGRVLRVAYPSGSFSPGQSSVRGGAGFEFHGAPAGATAACLSYKVRFPAGFDFVKGGKLPGLFGGDDPRGCLADDAVTGFSARLMWRTGGAGELYLYAPGRDARCGQSLGRGAWTFQPGRWTTIVEKAVVNAPGAADGSVEVWVDGRSVVKAQGLILGATRGASVGGVLFSTFFGGSDASWATPRDQALDFKDFELTSAAP